MIAGQPSCPRWLAVDATGDPELDPEDHHGRDKALIGLIGLCVIAWLVLYHPCVLS